MEHVPGVPEQARYHFGEVAQLAEPMQRILEQLRPDIEQGRYVVIIGDDASGRIPALLMDRVLRARYAELGYPMPETRFVAGSGSGEGQVSGEAGEQKAEALAAFVAGLNVPAGRRVLLVTDVVLSGKSLEPLMDALRHAGIPFDVATVGFDEGFGRDVRRDIERASDARIVAGGPDIFPRILGRHELSGVVKDKRQLHAGAYRTSKEYRSWVSWPYWWRSQQRINDVREDVGTLARELLDSYARE